jgi:tRNA pseudouridine38-40 synthase
VLRLKFVVAYDGRPFRGWQSQAGGGAVQDFLETAFARLCGDGVERVPVHGAGRTDAGVHARGQVAQADVPAEAFARLPRERWLTAVNAHLPPQIRVEKITRARAGWHARFSARGKWYRYRIWNAPTLQPLEFGRAWHLPGSLDFQLLRDMAATLAGTHDFAAFAANRGRGSKAPETTVRTLHRVAVRRGPGPLVTLDFVGDGFLYRQVRLMTGTLARVALGKMPPECIGELLDAKSSLKTSFAAPAEGLYLMRVLYRGGTG